MSNFAKLDAQFSSAWSEKLGKTCKAKERKIVKTEEVFTRKGYWENKSRTVDENIVVGASMYPFKSNPIKCETQDLMKNVSKDVAKNLKDVQGK